MGADCAALLAGVLQAGRAGQGRGLALQAGRAGRGRGLALQAGRAGWGQSPGRALNITVLGSPHETNHADATKAKGTQKGRGVAMLTRIFTREGYLALSSGFKCLVVLAVPFLEFSTRRESHPLCSLPLPALCSAGEPSCRRNYCLHREAGAAL